MNDFQYSFTSTFNNYQELICNNELICNKVVIPPHLKRVAVQKLALIFHKLM